METDCLKSLHMNKNTQNEDRIKEKTMLETKTTKGEEIRIVY